MRKTFLVLAFAAAIAAPISAVANTVDASLVPDGTYVVKVERIMDAQHMMVRMDNGIETTLAAKGAIDFLRVKSNDTVQLSVVHGKVPVFKIK
ncbi:MAG: hypothetical protein ABR584_05660 [Candidatus Baltobacteraceae bacterium]